MSPRRWDSCRSGSSRRDSCSVHSRRTERSGDVLALGAARSMKAASNSALWAVNTAPVEAIGELGRARRRNFGRVRARCRAGDAVDLARADPAPRPAQPHERGPLVDDLPADDGDQADLQDRGGAGSTARTSRCRRPRSGGVRPVRSSHPTTYTGGVASGRRRALGTPVRGSIDSFSSRLTRPASRRFRT